FAAGVAGFVSKTEPLASLRAAIRRVSTGGMHVPAQLERTTVVRPGRRLSEREAEVLRRVAMGFTNKEVAADLTLSVKSVEPYRSRAMTKLGLLTRHDVFLYASSTGLLPRRR